MRYFEHLRRTALIALVEAGITDVRIILTCLSHDSATNRFVHKNV
jgi:hypothetical protein